jgi:hypothetical protein
MAAEQAALLMANKVDLSEALMWHARAGQARRAARMLSLRDAALVEAMTESPKTAPALHRSKPRE